MTYIPPIDVTTANFQVPANAPSAPMYAVIQHLQASEITAKVVNGTGVFDVLMAGMKAHLDVEYQNNRITGNEYTKAYIAIAQTAMQGAIQFVLGREQAFWQAQSAQVQAITARIQNEAARYNYENLLPAQAEAANAQTKSTRLDGTPVTGVMGKQVDLYNQQIVSYQRDAEVKAAKLFTDAWVTQKTIDDGLNPPDGFTNPSLDGILAAVKVNNNFISAADMAAVKAAAIAGGTW